MEKENAERLKAAKELNDIRNLIDEIERIWNAPVFDKKKAKEIIQGVNRNHFENVVLYNLSTYRPRTNSSNAGSGISIDTATQSQLQEDLQWKHFYFKAKLVGKSVEEIIREWKNNIRQAHC